MSQLFSLVCNLALNAFLNVKNELILFYCHISRSTCRSKDVTSFLKWKTWWNARLLQDNYVNDFKRRITTNVTAAGSFAYWTILIYSQQPVLCVFSVYFGYSKKFRILILCIQSKMKKQEGQVINTSRFLMIFKIQKFPFVNNTHIDTIL
jgi:hypothetical protein